MSLQDVTRMFQFSMRVFPDLQVESSNQTVFASGVIGVFFKVQTLWSHGTSIG